MISLLFVSDVSIASQGAQNKLNIGYINFEPLYSTINNTPQGSLVTKTHKVYDVLNLKYNERALPTKRLFSRLKSGLTHIWCGIKVDSLQNDVISGSQALHYLSLNIYAIDQQINIQKKTDLYGKKLIILFGYSYDGWAQYIKNPDNNITYVEVKKHSAALKLLKSGRFDYLLNYQSPMEVALKQNPIDSLSIKNISKLPIVFNVSNKLNNAQNLLNDLDQALADLIQQGKIIVN
ncbi:substrate-binding periplasmic protein [Pseudoalteromonas denitrificans]|jgi:polar amino acid transport system substrate-binding protein|uniref:Extracellular solute-binding protein, family 3 n=1 Tax=Pseudoalteromonas denitrificans DSM 6059 TaxID=1123010 RepID=A0A1I1PRL6_9GAMM|nr:transporter substrate-binding domain-containing protein [Pseudoalteromonas denitrificans]SFD12486.1 extracellular solute-binding protein, family 3 [Pseudoalteromonas denitrificans DSM 6059]